MTTEKDLKDWYDKKYKEGINSIGRVYDSYPIFLDYLGVQKGGKLLDIGCGNGFLLRAASIRGLETFGIDISQEAVKIAENVSPDSSSILVGSGEELVFGDNEFDYVTCLGSLEHFLDMSKTLREMKRVAKENAMFCISVPNSNYLFGRISGRFGTEQRDINENLLSLKQWKSVFTDNGFEVLNVHQDRWLDLKKPLIFLSANPFRILKRIVYKLAWVFLPLNYTHQFIFILKKG